MKTALGVLLLVAVTNAFPLAFKLGQRYTFQYQTEVVHSIPGGASKQIGLQLQCKCHVTFLKFSRNPAEAQIKLENVALSQLVIEGQRTATPIQADPDAIAHLENNPIEIVFSATGRVKTIRVNQQDPEWSVNIKKGIANLLQISPKSEGMDIKQILTCKTPVVVSQKEPTIVGQCPVTYTVEPWLMQDPQSKKPVAAHRVTKTIDYDRCANRPSIRESIVLGQLCPSCQKSLGYVPYLRHAGHIEHILRDRMLMQATAKEMHTFTPFSELGGQVEATARQHLRFVSKSKAVSIMIMKKPMETGLLMKLVHPEQEARQNPQWRQGIQAKVTALLQILAREVQKDISSHVIPQTVAELVSHLRLCDTAALEQFLQAALKQQNEKVRELCIDALSLAGTTAFVQLVNKIQKEKRTSEIPLALFNRILVNIVFIPEVTPQHVNTVLNLCLNAPEFQPQAQLAIRRQCYLSFGALVNRLSQRPDAQQRTDIQTCIRTAITILTKKLQQAQNADEKLCFIKAIGNAGQPNAALQKILLQHLQNPNHPMVVRVECVWAFRRMVGPQRRDNLCNKLIGIFHDRRQHPELRMAIVELMLDRQPSFFNMQMFLNAAIREMQCQGPRSKQVASWVISKLSSMAYYNNVILQERARRARRALSSARRYVSRTAFGLEYSKAMRIAMYSEKLMSGFEMEMNKMNVPQSYIPRNMNARLMTHLMGHQFEVIQAGVRIEGLQDIIQNLMSEIRSRQKRSVWSSVWELFANDEDPTSDDYESGELEEESREPNASPRPTQKPQEKPKQPMQPMQPEVSVFMKVFNQEIQFVRITPATINQLVKQITQLLMGQKDEIQTAFGAITITKNSINIHQRFTKAFLAAHARQLEPTITGMPLHHHIISCLVTHVEATINIQAQPSLWKIFNAKSLTASVNARPKISVFTRGFIEVHTPFVRAGIKLQNVIQMKPIINLRLDAQTGISYTFKADVPTQKTDILVISPDPTKPEAVGVCGIVKTTTLRQFNIVPKEIPLTVSTQYMMQVDQMCYGQNLAGVAACAGGRLPSLSTLRFSDVPVFPFIAQTNVRVQIVPQDAVKQIQVQVNVDKQNRFQGDIIFKANGKTKREMTVRYTYALQLNRLVFNVKQITGLPSYLQARLTLNFNSLRNIDATLNQGQYQWKMTSTIDKSGRQITVQFNWNQLPLSLRQTLQQYEPQILYFLQTFASINRQQQSKNNIAITLHLLTPLVSQLRVQSPFGKVESKVLSLPVTVRRLPLSLKEILQWPYGQCQIQSVKQTMQKRVSIFDQKSYSFAAPRSPCQYILVQDSQHKLFRVSVQLQRRGQMNLIVQFQHPQQTLVVVKHDLTLMVNNKVLKQNVFQQQGLKIVKEQQSVVVTLNSMHFLQIQYQPENIQILASPSLRNQLRGLCGDNNGEDFQELRSPNNKILTQTAGFVKSWRTQC